jgi:hypothetical protein
MDMRIFVCLTILSLTLGFTAAAQTFYSPSGERAMVNTNIDMPGFLKIAQVAAAQREKHRLSEDEFIRVAKLPGTVLLDARSHNMFELLHIKGAVGLSFTDFTAESLAKVIPTKGTRVLIYCNNNFADSPLAFAAKSPPASLNLSTYISLYTYGYTNVYELGPFLKIKQTKIPFESNRGAKPGI